jgi:hypothetical protein
MTKEKLDPPFPEYRKLGKAKIYVCIHFPGDEFLVPAKITEEHWLQFRHNNKKWQILIVTQPKVMHQKRWWVKNERKLVFHCGWKSETTHDPEKTQLDLPTIDAAVKVAKPVIKGDMFKALAQSVKKRSGIEFWLPWVIVFVENIMLMYIFGGGTFG